MLLTIAIGMIRLQRDCEKASSGARRKDNGLLIHMENLTIHPYPYAPTMHIKAALNRLLLQKGSMSHLRDMLGYARQKTITHNRRDPQMVMHSSTSRPV